MENILSDYAGFDALNVTPQAIAVKESIEYYEKKLAMGYAIAKANREVVARLRKEGKL